MKRSTLASTRPTPWQIADLLLASWWPVADTPKNPNAHFDMGVMNLACDLIPEARECFNRAQALDPAFGEAVELLEATLRGQAHLNALPAMKGRCYRVDSGFCPEGTAADVLAYEQGALGNLPTVHPETVEALKAHHALDLVWVTRAKTAARRYGPNVMALTFPATAALIATDPDDGFLVLMDRRVAWEELFSRTRPMSGLTRLLETNALLAQVEAVQTRLAVDGADHFIHHARLAALGREMERRGLAFCPSDSDGEGLGPGLG